MRDNNNSYNKEIFNNLKILKMNIKIWTKNLLTLRIVKITLSRKKD